MLSVFSDALVLLGCDSSRAVSQILSRLPFNLVNLEYKTLTKTHKPKPADVSFTTLIILVGIRLTSW